MTDAHTPERWEADDCRVFMGDGGISLHRTPNGVQRARLIAAAPDLLASLIEVVAIADRKTDAFDRARAAILKATTPNAGERG